MFWGGERTTGESRERQEKPERKESGGAMKRKSVVQK